MRNEVKDFIVTLWEAGIRPSDCTDCYGEPGDPMPEQMLRAIVRGLNQAGFSVSEIRHLLSPGDFSTDEEIFQGHFMPMWCCITKTLVKAVESRAEAPQSTPSDT